jgi:hypothetical protein
MPSPLPAGVLPSGMRPVTELSAALAELAETAGLPGWAEEEAPEPAPQALAGVCAAGFARRGQGRGVGFADGGWADRLPAGVELAELAQGVWEAGLAGLTDDELVGVMAAWRRLASWAAAGELAAVAELDRRRQAQVAAGADPHVAEHVADEVAAALRLTAAGADRLVDLADRLTHLPGTAAALAAGRIDPRKAAVIAEETSVLDWVHAGAAEHLLLPDAGGQTTGQLRAAAKKAVAFVDPDALAQRRAQARKDARVEVWAEPAGTAALAGRDLPPASVLAASQHLTALARQLQQLGAEGTIDQLRARAYTALLLGQSPTDLLAAAQPPAPAQQPAAHNVTATGAPSQASPPAPIRPPAGPAPQPGNPACASGPPGGPVADPLEVPGGSSAAVPAAIPPGLGGSVNLTMPLATLLGHHQPGHAPGYGLLPADDCRALATAAAARTRWCLTLTGDDGQAVAHGCATSHTGTPGAGSDWALTLTIQPLASATCDHRRETASYQPPASLRHLITIRQPTCSFPGCRRPATRCDLDHTLAYQAGGRTCECNLAPLCRRHHQAKQAHGWHLDQPQTGHMTWTLPHGRQYTIQPGHSP